MTFCGNSVIFLSMEERQIYVFLPIWLEGGMIVARRRKMETALRKILRIAVYYGMAYTVVEIAEPLDCDVLTTVLPKYIPSKKSYEIKLRWMEGG